MVRVAGTHTFAKDANVSGNAAELTSTALLRHSHRDRVRFHGSLS